MPVRSSSTNLLEETSPKFGTGAVASWFARKKEAVLIGVAAFIVGAGVMLMYSPRQHIEVADSAVYDYMAQCIVRGQVPYRDVIDSKGPGSLYMSALVMIVGKPIGLQDIIAVRLFYV